MTFRSSASPNAPYLMLRRTVHRVVQVLIAFALAVAPAAVHAEASRAPSWGFVHTTYKEHTTRGELLRRLAQTRTNNSAYFTRLRAEGSADQADHLEGLISSAEQHTATYPDGDLVFDLPMIFVRRLTATVAGGPVTAAQALVSIGTMGFTEYTYFPDGPYGGPGSLESPITDFVSNDPAYGWSQGGSAAVRYDLINSPYQPSIGGWHYLDPSQYVLSWAYICEDTYGCAWSQPDTSVSAGVDNGGTRRHARLWGFGLSTSDGHDFTIADAHTDFSENGQHCLGDFVNAQSDFQYSLSYWVTNQYAMGFYNSGSYHACPSLGGWLYFNGQGNVHWVT